MTCQGVGALVGRGQQQGIETVADREHIALINAGAAASRFHIIDVIMGK